MKTSFDVIDGRFPEDYASYVGYYGAAHGQPVHCGKP